MNCSIRDEITQHLEIFPVPNIGGKEWSVKLNAIIPISQ